MRALNTLPLILFTAIAVCGVTNAQEDRYRSWQRPNHHERNRGRGQQPFQTDPLQTGFLVIDGLLIDSPYQIVWDGDELSLNGEILKSLSDFRTARRIYNELASDNIQIVCNGVVSSINISSDAGDAFLRIISTQKRSVSDIDEVMLALQNTPDTEGLREQLLLLKPNPTLMTRSKERLLAIENTRRTNVAANRAVLRLDDMAYPLTMLGMVLTVVAFGHLLSNRPDQSATASAINTTPEATRMVTRSVIFVVLLSSLDLIWTILASQAGQMKELNPLASYLIHDPKQLIAFKATATFAGAGLLLLLKKYRPAQTASWWMCLVCTVLTFRWITFNSLMMG